MPTAAENTCTHSHNHSDRIPTERKKTFAIRRYNAPDSEQIRAYRARLSRVRSSFERLSNNELRHDGSPSPDNIVVRPGVAAVVVHWTEQKRLCAADVLLPHNCGESHRSAQFRNAATTSTFELPWNA